MSSSNQSINDSGTGSPDKAARMDEKFARWLSMKDKMSFNTHLLNSKYFHDPHCAEHLLNYIGADPMGTNLLKFSEVSLQDGTGQPIDLFSDLRDYYAKEWDYAAVSQRQRAQWESTTTQFSSNSGQSKNKRSLKRA